MNKYAQVITLKYPTVTEIGKSQPTNSGPAGYALGIWPPHRIEAEMINIHSEIGKLRTVMVHRPGNEFKNVHPSMLAEQLFEDTPYLPVAQAEHDAFTNILRTAGVEVLEEASLFTEVMRDDYLRNQFTEEFVAASDIQSSGLGDSLRHYYAGLSTEDFVETVYTGIRADNQEVDDPTSLAGLVSHQGLFMVRPLANAYLTRDSSINIGDTYILAKMATAERRREPILVKYLIENARVYKGREIKNLYDPRLPWFVEGGNFMVLDERTVCVGCSQRTEASAIEVIADALFEHGFESVYVFNLGLTRELMYLDNMLSMVDRNIFIYNPLLSGDVPVYRMRPVYDGYPETEFVGNDWQRALREAMGNQDLVFIPAGGGDPFASAWETWNMGSNVLAIAPGEVVGLARAEVTLGLLEDAGVKVHAVSAPELTRGRAGCRSMVLPIVRDDL